MKHADINWGRIAEAVEYYCKLGFIYTDTPWYVRPEVAAITCPDVKCFDTIPLGGVLVASGEQGFLQMQIDGELTGVNYVTVTPCFRTNDIGKSDLHYPHFMKVELFVRCDSETQALFAAQELMHRARTFMTLCQTQEVETDIGWDLEVNGIEVGSYGARYHNDTGWWAYGTGLAEPRFSEALKNESNRDPSRRSH